MVSSIVPTAVQGDSTQMTTTHYFFKLSLDMFY